MLRQATFVTKPQVCLEGSHTNILNKETAFGRHSQNNAQLTYNLYCKLYIRILKHSRFVDTVVMLQYDSIFNILYNWATLYTYKYDC